MQSIENKKILILGGVAKMLYAVKVAKSMGMQVYVTDYLEDSPCKKVADKSFMVSATDVDAVVAPIKEERMYKAFACVDFLDKEGKTLKMDLSQYHDCLNLYQMNMKVGGYILNSIVLYFAVMPLFCGRYAA